jgi:hypothetical protein
MRLIFTVRSVTQVNVSRMLVELQGNRGNISLDLPLGHRIYVGQEFILDGPDVVSAAEIDEVAERDGTRAISAPAAPRSTNLISLEPRDRLSREDLLD